MTIAPGTETVAKPAQSAWRLVTGLCLALLPATGLIVAPAEAAAGLQPVTAAVIATMLTFALNELFASENAGRNLPRILIQLAAFFLLPGMGLMPGNPGQAGGWAYQIQTAAAWTGGCLLAGLCHLARQTLAWQRGKVETALIPGRQLLLSFATLALGFWLIAALLPGEIPAGTARQSLAALLLAAWTLSGSCLLLLAITIAGDKEEHCPSEAAPVLALLIALVSCALLSRITDPSEAGGAVLTAILAAALSLVFLLRRFIALLAAAMLVMPASPWFTGFLTLHPPAAWLGLAILVLALPVAIMRTSRRRGGSLARAGDPPPAVVTEFNQRSTSWLARIDLEKQTLHFPFGSGFAPGSSHTAGFRQIIQESGYSGLLDLLHELQKPASGGFRPVRIMLQFRSTDEAARGRSVARAFEVPILESSGQVAWLLLISLSREAVLSDRAAQAERLFSEAMLREERLLSLASHELRTPVAILSMLAEDLNAGAPWQALAGRFDQTTNRILGILDDLRADGGAGHGLAAGQSFTPEDVLVQLLAEFRPAAAAKGISLEGELADQASLPMIGDQARIIVSLSKLVHNALVHSRATRVRISLIVSRAGKDLALTWQVSDDGKGIAEEERYRIFEPFETQSSARSDGSGLGLYTARKAIRLIGGDLILAEEHRGARFILTHPARLAAEPG